MPDKKLVDEAIEYLKSEIKKLEENLEESKEDLKWYKLTGDNRSYSNPKVSIPYYKEKLYEKKALLKKNIKKLKKINGS